MASRVALVRPLDLAGIALAACVGARLGRAPIEWGAVLVPVLIGAFGYARNDAADLAADRVNRPARPIPSGALTPHAAHAVSAFALAAAAVALGLARRDAISVAIAAVAAALLALYSPWLKGRGAAGPAAIALLTFLAVGWGAAPGSAPERAALPALLAAAVQFARECVKQLEDAPGDRAAGQATWVISSGAAAVTRAARLALLAALLLLPLPSTAGGLPRLYLWVVFPSAGLLIVWALAALGGDAPAHGRISAALKISMFCGLAALTLAT